MMDVTEWLRSLSLEQYASIFRQNEIDHEVLPDLTEADLEKLGAPMRHRKRLVRAMAVLSAAVATAAPAAHRQLANSGSGMRRRSAAS
jgi:SAM (Sterile alpha motif) domain-containing protein